MPSTVARCSAGSWQAWWTTPTRSGSPATTARRRSAPPSPNARSSRGRRHPIGPPAIDPERIGVAGHSQGGWVVQEIAVEVDDTARGLDGRLSGRERGGRRGIDEHAVGARQR